jgi:antitoxin PrlF
MPAATLTEKGQIVIPAEIRARYELTPGTQVEFVDEGGVIRLLVRRRVASSEPAAGYGLVKVKSSGRPSKLSEFDPALALKKQRRP